MSKKIKLPKILVLDIETAPILGYMWSIWQDGIGLNQIESDWYILSWAAKWLHEKKVMYADQRNAKNIEDDSKILREIWKLLDEADIIVTQNGKRFDEKKLNSRFLLNGFKPPSGYKHIDVYEIAKKKFGFTSNKLEYLTDKLCKKHKKSNHKKFPGFELWRECLKGNVAAWKEMEKYNKLDVTSLEELYKVMYPWDNSLNFNLYHDEETVVCACGSTEFQKKGFAYTAVSKFQRYICKKCGAQTRGRKNLLGAAKRASLTTKIKS